MPVSPTYPGVYVEEIPSGVRTIVGVATAITAFVGRALRGPVNEPTLINNYSDYERQFGGLWLKSPLSFAVRDFYLNGGSQALIIRVYKPEDQGTGVASNQIGDLTLQAVSPGAWGNKLRLKADQDNIPDAIVAQYGLTKSDFFNLTVTDNGTGQVERYLNLTTADTPLRVDRVLADSSSLVSWQGAWPAQTPKVPKSTDSDKLGQAEQAVATARNKLTQAQSDYATALANANGDTTAGPVVAAKTALDAAKAALDTANTAYATAESGLGGKDGVAPTSTEYTMGYQTLDTVDVFNLLCLTPYALDTDVDPTLIGNAAAYCESMHAFLIVDAPHDWKDANTAKGKFLDTNIDFVGTRSNHAGIFYPRLRQQNPLHNNQVEVFVPCGAVAGVFSRTDVQRGVWKAPAGLDATLNNVVGL
ncbi:MAG TPA: hypothetical protein VMT34_07275, partial [Aggregatilineales bacterium]|nr:hypothetical protein [Aggregatilineales bacterium]